MIKIYLMSGPSRDGKFNEDIKRELEKDLINCGNCVFIPTSFRNYERNDSYAELIFNSLKDFTSISDYKIIDNKLTNEKKIEALENCDMIYLLGGNPSEQLKNIIDYNLSEYIKNFKGIIIGTSAGAMNLACLAYYSKDKDCDKSYFYNGLGLVDVTIDPHFDINNEIQVSEAKKFSFRHEIIGLPDTSAVIVSDEGIKYVGDYFKFVDGNKVK